jgi:hypothetical protein
MRKYHGKVTYRYVEETAPGVFEEVEKSRTYKGDVIEERRSLAYRDTINGSLGTSTRVSIVADKFAFSHFTDIVSLELWGKRWQVSSAVPAHPRIECTLGDLYTVNTEDDDEQEASTDGQ